MSPATRAAVRYGLHKGYRMYAVQGGFDGLVRGDVEQLSWLDVDGWTSKGGSDIGTNRSQPSKDYGMVAYQLQRFNIHGLLVIGGFEAFTALQQLYEQRGVYPAFCIPMVHLPATISNNVPGTEYSLGCDTALNAIVEGCDRIRQSASASRERTFMVEVQGGHCGYLATMAGLTCGATCMYLPEEGIDIAMIQRDLQHLVSRFKAHTASGRVVIRNEKASSTYTTEMLSEIFRAESQGYYEVRSAILGHIQQGGAPSPLDRIRGTRLAVLCMTFLEKWLKKAEESVTAAAPRTLDIPAASLRAANLTCHMTDPASAAVIGIKGAGVVYTPIAQLTANDTNFKYRRPKQQWWLNLVPLSRMLAKYDAATL